MSTNKDDVTPSPERLIGRVKWFNNKAGYGFLTVTDGTRSGTDIFVHHSSINVENQQYKYLVQGEYLEFYLNKTTSGPHEWQAIQVSGINGGKLMCETRREFKLARTNYKSEKVETPNVQAEPVVKEETKMPRQPRVPKDASSTPKTQRAPRARGEGPREGSESKEWKLVGKKSDTKVSSKSSRQ
jgi:CspA family cold shock protein